MNNRIFYRDGYRYQLAHSYEHLLPERFAKLSINCKNFTLKDRLLTIFGGYAWDGASGPTLDTRSCVRGTLVHDALYEAIRAGFISPKLREAADAEMYRIFLEDRMLKPRAWLWLKMVRRYGAKHTRVESERPILTAGPARN